MKVFQAGLIGTVVVVGSVIGAAADECPHAVGTSPTHGGVSLTAVDGLAYVAGGTSGLHILDMSDPGEPIWLGTATSPIGGSMTQVVVQGDYAYVSGGSLEIIDVSDPTAPEYLSFEGFPEGYQADVAGSYAYVVDGWGGLYVVDVSDPTDPYLFAHLQTADFATSVRVDGSLVYVGESGGLRVVDVSDPSQPTTIGFMVLPNNTPKDIRVHEGVAYLSSGYANVVIADVSDPTTPVVLAQIVPDDRVWELDFHDGYLYLGDDDLRVMDVRDPTSPAEVGRFAYYEPDVAIMGDYVLLTRGSPQIQILQGCAAAGFADGFESGDTSAWGSAVP